MANWLEGGALLVNASRDFNTVVDYYRMFGTEPTAETNTFVTVSLVGGREAKFGPGLFRFTNFLELIQGLTVVAARGWAILVNHGMSDPNDQPLGLLLELTRNHSPWRVDEYVLELLTGFIDNEPADDDLAKLERSLRITAANTPLPPGTLKQLHEALKVFRKRGKSPSRLCKIKPCCASHPRNDGGIPPMRHLMLIYAACACPDFCHSYGFSEQEAAASRDKSMQPWRQFECNATTGKGFRDHRSHICT